MWAWSRSRDPANFWVLKANSVNVTLTNTLVGLWHYLYQFIKHVYMYVRIRLICEIFAAITTLCRKKNIELNAQQRC